MGKENNKTIRLQPKQVTLAFRRQKIVPELRIAGGWLEEQGFLAGDHVRIIVRERLLIIEPLEGRDKEAADNKAALRKIKNDLKELSK